jgi:OTU domain-containing protein 5
LLIFPDHFFSLHLLIWQERDQEHFSQFVTGEPFSEYIARKRLDGVHGNNPEIQAISELFNRPIEVFTPETGAKPLNIFHAEYKTDDAPIRLSYHDGNHYNAVIDPLVPTAGLGLGLPGLQPGLADKLQMAKAVAESDAVADKMELQRAMKESEDDELQRKIKESEEDELQRAIKLSRMSADAVSSFGLVFLVCYLSSL